MNWPATRASGGASDWPAWSEAKLRKPGMPPNAKRAASGRAASSAAAREAAAEVASAKKAFAPESRSR